MRDGDVIGESGRRFSRGTLSERDFIHRGRGHRGVLAKTRRRGNRERGDFLLPERVGERDFTRGTRGVEFYATHERDRDADEKDERSGETGEDFRDEENGAGTAGDR